MTNQIPPPPDPLTAIGTIDRRSIRHSCLMMRGCLDKIIATLADEPESCSTFRGRARVSDEKRETQALEAAAKAILIDKAKEPYREHKRLMKAYRMALAVYPSDTTGPASWVAYAARQRLLHEYHHNVIPLLTESRLVDVTKELEKVPLNVVKALVNRGLPVQPGPELDEAIARAELEGWATPAERKAKEKAFTKRFGHAP